MGKLLVWGTYILGTTHIGMTIGNQLIPSVRKIWKPLFAHVHPGTLDGEERPFWRIHSYRNPFSKYGYTSRMTWPVIWGCQPVIFSAAQLIPKNSIHVWLPQRSRALIVPKLIVQAVLQKSTSPIEIHREHSTPLETLEINN